MIASLRDGPRPTPAKPDDWTLWLTGTRSRLAHQAGAGLARAQRWVRDEALEDHTLATLATAFGLGLLTGWFIKRRS